MEIKPLFKTTLAADLPAGPYPGQHFHPKGSEFVINNLVESDLLGACSFPAPDPVFFYLNIAEERLEFLVRKLGEIKSTQSPIFFRGKGTINSLKEDLVYPYFQANFQFVIMLYIGCEAFANQHIPKLDVYPIQDKYGKTFNIRDKEEFERKASTKQKLRLISQNLGLGNPKDQDFWKDFCALSDLRHDIVHLKTKGTSTFTCYQDIYKRLIDTNHSQLFESAKAMLQFFDPKIFD